MTPSSDPARAEGQPELSERCAVDEALDDYGIRLSEYKPLDIKIQRLMQQLGQARRDLDRLRRAALAWQVRRSPKFEMTAYVGKNPAQWLIARVVWEGQKRVTTEDGDMWIPDDSGVPASTEEQMALIRRELA